MMQNLFLSERDRLAGGGGLFDNRQPQRKAVSSTKPLHHGGYSGRSQQRGKGGDSESGSGSYGVNESKSNTSPDPEYVVDIYKIDQMMETRTTVMVCARTVHLWYS